MNEFEGVTPQSIAMDLLDSWVNGNRKYVMDEIQKLSTMRAAAVVGHMIRDIYYAPGRLGSKDDHSMDLIRMIERRA